MEIIVRKAMVEDYNALCELFDEVDALHRDNLPHLFQKPGGAVREQDYYLEQIDDENTALFVAEAAKQLVGLVHGIILEVPAISVFVPRRYGMVNTIVVRSEFQNQGIGRRLIGEMQAWAIAKEATSLELNVYQFNETARSFYERLGYQTLSRKMSKDLKER